MTRSLIGFSSGIKYLAFQNQDLVHLLNFLQLFFPLQLNNHHATFLCLINISLLQEHHHVYARSSIKYFPLGLKSASIGVLSLML